MVRYGWLKSGKLVGVKVGKEYRVKESDLSAYIKGNHHNTGLRHKDFRRRRKVEDQSGSDPSEKGML